MVTTNREALEPDAAFIQRLFEKKWVEELGKKWGDGRSSTPSAEGAFPRLHETTLGNVIQVALPRLKARGYALTNPGQTRLRVLLDKLKHNALGSTNRPEW
jgi:hypothetical protein